MTITPPPNPFQSRHQKAQHSLIDVMMNSKKTTAFTAITVILAAGISIKANIHFSASSGQVTEVTQPSILPGAYERVDHDMAIVEVQGLLGPGIEVSSSKTAAVYQWKDSAGNCITATFENGLLQQKNRQCSLPL